MAPANSSSVCVPAVPLGIGGAGRLRAASAAMVLIALASPAWSKPSAPSAAAAAAPAASSFVGLHGVRFGGDAVTTRVVLDLDGAVTARSVPADAAADRLVIALPSLLSSGPMEGKGQGLVRAWSVRAEGRGSRLILDLAPGAVAEHRFLIPPTTDGGRWRFVVDVHDSDPLAVLAAGGVPAVLAPPLRRPTVVAVVDSRPKPAAPAAAARPTPTDLGSDVALIGAPAPVASVDLVSMPRAAAPPPTRTVPAGIRISNPARISTRGAGARALRIVVVDAGHGGHDPGARSLVRNEKDVTLAAALALKVRLEKLGGYKVVLTRGGDVFIPLEERVQIARRAGADLFISLHADSAGSDPTPHGASVYTLSDHGQTRVNTVLGPHEWFAHAGDRRTEPGVRQILLDLTQRSTRNRSSQFAGLLIDHIGNRVDLLPRTHRDAGYFVLLAPDVPAVLLEMGFITNPADEMRLTDPAQRERLMIGVAEAIDAYFSGETRLTAG